MFWYLSLCLQVTLVTFATYVLWDRNSYLDPGKAFVSLSLFNLLRPPLTLISSMIMYTIQVCPPAGTGYDTSLPSSHDTRLCHIISFLAFTVSMKEGRDE